jgi:hypothetical protein
MWKALKCWLAFPVRAKSNTELWTEEDEKRVDIIGQNGPVGYSIEEMYAEGEKDYGA